MKKILKIFLNLFMFIILIFSSCEKREMNTIQNDEMLHYRNGNNVKSNDDILFQLKKEFAYSLFNSLQNEMNLRSYVYAKLKKADTSHYEFMLIESKNDLLSSGKTFLNTLIHYSHNDSDLSLMEINDKLPLLSISVPDIDLQSFDNWDDQTLPTIITFQMFDTTTSYFIFNSLYPNGKKVSSKDIEDYLNVPVLVIKDAEIHYFVTEEGFTSWGNHITDYLPIMPPVDPSGDTPSKVDCVQFLLDAIAALESYIIKGNKYFLIEHDKLLKLYYECIKTNGGGGTEPCNEPCERDCETLDEHLVDFRIDGWGVWKNIDNQFLEKYYVFHADVLAATVLSNGTVNPFNAKMVTPAYKKKDILDCSDHWDHPCQGIWKEQMYRFWKDWHLDEFASPYYIQWAEVDNGSSKFTFSLPFTVKFKSTFNGLEQEFSEGVKVDYSYTANNIVNLGNAPVFYCDKILRVNDTESIQFRCD